MRERAPVLLSLLLVGCAAVGQAFASVTASLDTSQVAAGDTVQLTLEHDGSTSGQPDVAPLQQSFDILGTSSSTSIELINGSASEKTEVVLTLAPKVTGHLTIPALSWGGEQTRPLALTVTGPGSNAQPAGSGGASGAASAAKVFIETSAA
ncbi:MAG: BatD family protein, partial [Gammaproteobacteria bacterium]|nr:BatD family protein [Gammaproteobacteria bacterium]